MKNFFGPIKSGIIFAADLPSLEENCQILDQIHSQIDVIKINVPLIYRDTPEVITRLNEKYEVPVFADIKIADVPHTCVAIVDIVREFGAAAVMVHGIVGPDCLQDCIDATNDELGIIVQLELTNPGGIMFTQPIADDMASAASLLDIYGTQAPGNRPERISAIRQIVGPDRVIVCCGVGAQGGSYHAVREAGGDYAIIGRAIYQSEDPRGEIERITSIENDK